MEASLKFTDREATPEQRQDLINKARAWSVAQGATPSAEAEALYARYVSGFITLQGITDTLRATDQQRLDAQAAAVQARSLVQPAVMQHERVTLD